MAAVTRLRRRLRQYSVTRAPLYTAAAGFQTPGQTAGQAGGAAAEDAGAGACVAGQLQPGGRAVRPDPRLQQPGPALGARDCEARRPNPHLPLPHRPAPGSRLTSDTAQCSRLSAGGN